MDARFEACLPFILKEEGGNDDDPHDHGGRTSRGITQREYTAWSHKPGRDVFDATDQEIHDIYYESYWLPRGPKLHPGVDLVYFNFAVNAGAGEAHKLLMRSIGPDDVANDDITINRMCNSGEVFYRGLAQFPRYGRGWTARTERIRAAALKMQAEAPKQPNPKIDTIPQPPQPQETIIMNLVNLIAAAPTLFADIEAAWPVFMAAEQAVVKLIQDVSKPQAIAATADHLTAGKPNSPALNG